jgi:hypothetical protein
MEKDLVSKQRHCSDTHDSQSPSDKGVHVCTPFLFKEKKGGRDGFPAQPFYQRPMQPILPLPQPMVGLKEAI